MLGVHERADLGRGIVRIPDLHALRLRRVALDELVVHLALHEDARARRAALAVEREHAEDRRVDRGLEVGIREHDGGGLAAELHRQALQERRRVAEDQLPGRALARERDERDIGMLHQRVAGILAESVHEVEDALRQPRLFEDPRPQRRRQGSELGRLQHDRVAGREGGAELPRLEHERRVPRRDEPRDADRLAVDVVDLAARHLVGVVGLRHDQVGEEPEVLGRAPRLPERLRDRQARVEALELGEPGIPRLDDVGDAVQDPGALARQHPGPRSLGERAPRSRDGPVDVGLLAGGGLQVDLVRDRVEHVERVAVGRVDELAVDVVLDARRQVLGHMPRVESGGGVSHGLSCRQWCEESGCRASRNAFIVRQR